MNRKYHYSFIALMEPFQAFEELHQYKQRLSIDHALVNHSGKI